MSQTTVAAVNVQIDRLCELGYPDVAGVSAGEFRQRLQPLAELAPTDIPSVVVIDDSVITPDVTVQKLRVGRSKKPGFVDPHHGPDGLASYRPIESVAVPPGFAYLLVGFDRGLEFRGQTPQDVTPVIEAGGRTPLTISEGIAIATQFPELLAPNECYMMTGSRRGDKRVPALWISGGAPKLGWCWNGNHHTWLGIGSAAARVGFDDAG